MDSKVVSKAIKETIRPFLKSEGFTEFNDRNAWRHSDDKIDVINFQSYNKYSADVMGCTTFSFSVNLGVYLKYIPREYGIKEKNGLLYPMEYECHFRASLRRGYREWFKKINTLWYINKKGTNIDKAINDAHEQIRNYALPWFDIFSNDNDILLLLQDKLRPQIHTWGHGANPSPNRSLLRGYVSARLKQNESAKEDLHFALDSGCYDGIRNSITEFIHKL